MIQFNLLPDVKLEYIKAKYKRRVIAFFGIVISSAFLVVFIMMFIHVKVTQETHLSNLDGDIKDGVAELRKNEDLDKILTIQSQLGILPDLHGDKVMVSRLFDYLTQLTPNDANISSVELDVESKKIIIKGSANSPQTVNQFVDTIKFTEFKLTGDEPKEGRAFNSVVLNEFTISEEGSGTQSADAISYEIEFIYDEAIFMDTAVEGKPTQNSVKLTVPKTITTRSETEKPSALFKPEPTNDQEETNQ